MTTKSVDRRRVNLQEFWKKKKAAVEKSAREKKVHAFRAPVARFEL